MLLQRVFEEQAGGRAGAPAHHHLALHHVPLEIFHRHLLARHQKQPVGGGDGGEHLGLERRFAVFDIDSRLRALQDDIDPAGQQHRRALVAAPGGGHVDLDTLFGEKAFRQRDVFRQIEDGPYDLGVLDRGHFLGGGVRGQTRNAGGEHSRGRDRQQRLA